MQAVLGPRAQPAPWALAPARSAALRFSSDVSPHSLDLGLRCDSQPSLLPQQTNASVGRTELPAQGSLVSNQQITPTGHTAPPHLHTHAFTLELARTPPSSARARCQVTRTGCPRPPHSLFPPPCQPQRYSPLTAGPGGSPRSRPSRSRKDSGASSYPLPGPDPLVSRRACGRLRRLERGSYSGRGAGGTQ